MIEYKTASWSTLRRTADYAQLRTVDKFLVAMRLLLLSLIFMVPWYYGTVDWTTQYYYLMAAIAVCVIAFGGLFWRYFRNSTDPTANDDYCRLCPPLPAVIFLVVALWSLMQSIPMYDIAGGDTGPNSVRIQRFYLGESVPSVAEKLELAPTTLSPQVEGNATSSDSTPPSGNAFLPDSLKSHKLAWSVEPLHTKGAIGMMGLIAALVWLGRAYFSSANGLTWLLVGTTAIGFAVGMYGIASLLDFRPQNALGLGKGTSFGPFVSRNIGGCYMNLCLAASLGLTMIAFSRGGRNRVDRRYAPMNSSTWEHLASRVELSIGQLTTFQIACVVATAVLMASVFSTASRGASIGGAVAILAVFLMSTGRGISFGRVAIASIVLAIGVSFLFWFELDDRLRERLDRSVWDEDFESARKLIWSISRTATEFYFSTGSGLGTFHFAHLPFQKEAINGWFYNAESLYWETLVDLGWVGALAIVFLLLTFAFIIWPRSESKLEAQSVTRLGAARTTALAMFLSVGVHSFFDFSMIIPACFVTGALLLGATHGASEFETSTAKPRVPSATTNGSRLRSGFRRRRTSEGSLTTTTNLKPAHDTTQESSQGESELRASVSRPQERSSRSSRPISNPIPSIPPETRWGTLSAITMAISTVALMYSSIPALELLGRGDRMRKFASRQLRLPKDERAANSTYLLAGIWGKDVESLDKSSDGLRLLALSFMSDFQRKRVEDLEEQLSLPRSEAAALATPTMTRIGLASLNGDSKAIDGYFVSELQKERWFRTREMLQKAIVHSPLDWRISYSLYLLSFDLPEDQLSALANRFQPLSRHRPSSQLQIAAIEKASGRDEQAIALLRSCVETRSGLVTRVAQLLTAWYPDAQIPIDIFPDDPAQLLQVAAVVARDKFPTSHELVLTRAEASASALPRIDTNRAIYLSSIARYRGDLRAALDYLMEASQRKIVNTQIRFEMIQLAIQLGDWELAETELGNIRFIAGDDPRIDAFQKQIDNANK